MNESLVDSTLGKNKTEKIKCIHCYSEIIEYYHDKYKGNRGKCLICKVDFPLD